MDIEVILNATNIRAYCEAGDLTILAIQVQGEDPGCRRLMLYKTSSRTGSCGQEPVPSIRSSRRPAGPLARPARQAWEAEVRVVHKDKAEVPVEGATAPGVPHDGLVVGEPGAVLQLPAAAAEVAEAGKVPGQAQFRRTGGQVRSGSGPGTSQESRGPTCRSRGPA